MKIGFIGLGIMGSYMALNLLKHGVELNVYNRTKEKAKKHLERGAVFLNTPREVALNSDIIFMMLSDSQACKNTTEGKNGLLDGLNSKNIVVNLSTIEPDYSLELYEKVRSKDSLFLEAPVVGSKIPARDANLIMLTAGDKNALDKATTYLEMMGKRIINVGSIPKASYLKVVNNQIMGIMMAALAEGLMLAKKIGLNQNIVYDLVNSGAFANPMFKLKGENIIHGNFETHFPYKHMQKDLGFAINLAEKLKAFCPATSAVNNSYVLGYNKYEDEDMCAIYKSLNSN